MFNKNQRVLSVKGVIMFSILLSVVVLFTTITQLFLSTQDDVSQQASNISGVEYFEQLTQADRLYAEQKYADAVKIYERLSKSYPSNGKLVERIFDCNARLGNRKAAAQIGDQMLQLGHGRGPLSQYAIAQYHALSGDDEEAFDWFEKALDNRFKFRSRLHTNSSFNSLRDDPRFANLAGLLPNKDFTREEGWRYDLDFFAKEVARLSADPERYGASEEFLHKVQELSERVPGLSNEQVALELQRILVSLGNGHSNIYPIPTKHVRFTMLPIQLYLFSDGMFVVNGKGEAASLVGHQVLSIGSKSIEVLLAEARPIIHRDNEMGLSWLGPQFLCIPEVLEYLDATGTHEKVAIKLKDPEGNLKTIDLKGGPMSRPAKLGPAGTKDQAPLFLKEVSNNYWLHKLPQSNAIYFQFNQVRDKQGGKSINNFADELRQMIIDEKPRNLIVDLRHNNGGVAFLSRPLVRPLVFFEMLDKENRLFVITGRNTFSAAQGFLNTIDAVANPIIVGEPSSSRPNVASAESEVVLPWSGLRMSVAFYYFQDSTPWDMRPWIPTHVPVELSSSDYFSNRDPAMAAIKEIIDKQ